MGKWRNATLICTLVMPLALGLGTSAGYAANTEHDVQATDVSVHKYVT